MFVCGEATVEEYEEQEVTEWAGDGCDVHFLFPEEKGGLRLRFGFRRDQKTWAWCTQETHRVLILWFKKKRHYSWRTRKLSCHSWMSLKLCQRLTCYISPASRCIKFIELLYSGFACWKPAGTSREAKTTETVILRQNPTCVSEVMLFYQRYAEASQLINITKKWEKIERERHTMKHHDEDVLAVC